MYQVLIPAAIAAGSALMQYMNSKDAQRLSEAERKKLEEMLAKIEDPQFDTSDITPEEYRVVSRYVPEVANFVAEERPEIVQLASEDAKRGRSAFREGLMALQRAATDATERNLSIDEALSAAREESGARDASIAQSFAARGVGGGGLEALLRANAGQQGAKTAAEVTRRATRDSMRSQLENMVRAAEMGRTLTEDERRTEEGNVGIINSWNQRDAAAKRNFAQTAADTRNDAQRMNVNMDNEVGFKNTSARNAAKEEGVGRRNTLAQRGFDNAVTRVTGARQNANMARDDYGNAAMQGNATIAGAANAAQILSDRAFNSRPTSRPLASEDETETMDYGYPSQGRGPRTYRRGSGEQDETDY